MGSKIEYGHIYNREETEDILFVPIFSWNEYNDALVIINPYIEDYCVDQWDRATMGAWREVATVSEENKRLILSTLLSFSGVM